MTPEERDQHILTVLQACVDMLPSSMIELWYRLETAGGVTSSEVFFTTSAGVSTTNAFDYSTALKEAEADLVRANMSDPTPFTTALLHYRAEGGMTADFGYEPVDVMEGYDERVDAWTTEQFQSTIPDMTYFSGRS